MQSLVLLAPALLALASTFYAATPPKKAVPPTTQPSVKPAAKTPPKTAAKPRTYSRYRAPVRYVARPAAQQMPTADRYKEIQQAMADKGYFKGNVDGQWNQDSVDALKHFQTDQNLPAEGRLDSLSLIGLGLGPKRMTAQSAPQAAPPASQIEKQ